jgi:Ca-activated chloride channel family protein
MSAVSSQCCLLLATTLAWAAERPPTFEAGVEVVHVAVSVTDERNRHVTGLSERDFVLFEDGRRQEISFFAKEALPLSVTLLIDGSASMVDKLETARAAGTRFIATLRPQDAAQVVAFNDRMAILQDFTPDHQRLEGALAAVEAGGTTALYNALYITFKECKAEAPGSEPRRRALIVLSDGEDTTSLLTDEQVMEAARKADVAVYAIGLSSGTPQEKASAAHGRAVHFLTALARDTGGRVYFPTAPSGLDDAYDRIGDELRTQYTLGYLSTNARKDGGWRHLLVRTTAAVDVHHKPGYYAAKQRAPISTTPARPSPQGR